MDIANDKPTPKWSHFAAWSVVGAIFILAVWGGISFLYQDGKGATLPSPEDAAILGGALILAAAVIGFTGRKRPVSLRNLRNFLIQNAVALSAFLLVIWGFDAGVFGEVEGSGAAALAVGVIFLAIGVFIGAGLANPAYGARYLNVEDAGELRELRSILLCSASAMAAWGLALMLVVAGGPSGSVSPTAALAGAGALFTISAVLSVVAWRLMDELMRRLSTEAGNISFYLVAVLGGGWAMLAHLGFVAAPASLDWLTILTGSCLLASFIGAGRRGLLAQRSK